MADCAMIYSFIYCGIYGTIITNRMEARKYFSSSTLMGKQQNKKVHQLLQNLLDTNDSFEFRAPVDYMALGLHDYPMIVKKPMDLNTVKRNLTNNAYDTVEGCLADIQLIWDNCKLYNTTDNWIYKQAEKLDKMTKKMIRNYVPFVKIENPTDKRRGPHKKDVANARKTAIKVPQPEPKDYLEKMEQCQKPEQVIVESEYTKQRKHFLMYIPLCSPEQVGVIFMLLNKNCPEALEFDDSGGVNVVMDNVGDALVKRLIDQLDMWGVGYAPTKRK